MQGQSGKTTDEATATPLSPDIERTNLGDFMSTMIVERITRVLATINPAFGSLNFSSCLPLPFWGTPGP
jgi:hypothetical protein